MVYEYEVELRIANKNTGDNRLVKRIEFAYNPLDAYQQAVVNQAADIDTGSADIKVMSVKPPTRLIELSAANIRKSVQDLTSRLFVDAASPGNTPKPGKG